MTASGERQLQQALRDLASALSATGAPWMIIGGIAVIARGVRRFTADIDAAIQGDEIDITPLVKALSRKRIVPRIAGVKEFARESLVLLMRHEPSGVELDVSLAWTEFEHAAIAAATVEPFGTVRAPMARPEDLIVFKAIAGRGKDYDDVISLLTLYPTVDLAQIRARVRELAAAADAPELVAGLETAIATATTPRALTPTGQDVSVRRTRAKPDTRDATKRSRPSSKKPTKRSRPSSKKRTKRSRPSSKRKKR